MRVTTQDYKFGKGKQKSLTKATYDGGAINVQPKRRGCWYPKRKYLSAWSVRFREGWGL